MCLFVNNRYSDAGARWMIPEQQELLERQLVRLFDSIYFTDNIFVLILK
jgi:hypothetical protein